MQQVYLGQTRNGQYGFFTGGYLVIGISKERYDCFAADSSQAAIYCAGRGFKFVDKHTASAC